MLQHRVGVTSKTLLSLCSWGPILLCAPCPCGEGSGRHRGIEYSRSAAAPLSALDLSQCFVASLGLFSFLRNLSRNNPHWGKN